MPKKMRKNDSTHQIGYDGYTDPHRKAVAQILSYRPPVYRENKSGGYIEFYAFDPASGSQRRKRIKVNTIKGVRQRREYAKEVMRRISEHLHNGWNPWTCRAIEEYELFDDCLDKWDEHVHKLHSNGLYRRQTFDDYVSKIKILREFIADRKPIRYMYQFDKKFCVAFLDYVYIERNNGAQTHNNYLNWLRTLAQWFMDRGIIDRKPTDGIQPISRRLFEKSRTCIPSDKLKEIGEWTKKHDPRFALACQLLYYCFIRPVEMTRLKVSDFNLQESTVTIPATASKNKKTQTVTVPKKVLLYAVELGVFSAPMQDYIFSKGLKPGQTMIDPKLFRDHWAKVSKNLKLKSEWKFYSLKDSGITDMLRANSAAPVDVKDQARHSSFKITEIYLGQTRKAVPEIIEIDGPL